MQRTSATASQHHGKETTIHFETFKYRYAFFREGKYILLIKIVNNEKNEKKARRKVFIDIDREYFTNKLPTCEKI